MDGTDDDVRVTIVAHVESDDVRSSSQGSDRGGNAGLDVGDEERNTESGSIVKPMPCIGVCDNAGN